MEHKACVHHWHIDRLDIGTCQKCGKVKNFHKFLNREKWFGKTPKGGAQ